MQQLGRCANRKMKYYLRKYEWSARALPRVIEEASRTTNDKSLRNILTAAAAEHIEELVEQDDFTNMTDDFTLALFKSIIKTFKSRESQLMEDFSSERASLAEASQSIADDLEMMQGLLDSSKAEVTQVRSGLEQEMNDVRIKFDKLQGCVNKLKGTRRCRHCKADFECYVEESQWLGGSSYVLRCQQCTTRH